MRLALLVVIAVVVAATVGAVWLVTQPLLRARRPTGVVRVVEPARLEAHVRTIAVELGPRDHTHPGNLDRVATYVAGGFHATGGRVTEQRYTPTTATYRNVIASYGPDDGARIVVGAHYDTAGPLPGADDNASGVAGLLELAVLLGRTRTLPLRVDLVAYTLEEPPFFTTSGMGSWVHAVSLRQAGIAVRAMFSLEMIGYFSDEPASQAVPHPMLRLAYPSRGDFIAVVGRLRDGALVRTTKSAMRGAGDLPVVSINAPGWVPGVDFSDHRSFWAHGYPAVMITDTAFYRNRHYHAASDTPETLDYGRMAKVVRGVYEAVLALSE